MVNNIEFAIPTLLRCPFGHNLSYTAAEEADLSPDGIRYIESIICDTCGRQYWLWNYYQAGYLAVNVQYKAKHFREGLRCEVQVQYITFMEK